MRTVIYVIMQQVVAVSYRSFRSTYWSHLNTLWTGDADLRLYITTVQDG